MGLPSVRAKRLMGSMKATYITHDLASAYYISDRIIIMQKGQVVESGDARVVLSEPKHPYSILLEIVRELAPTIMRYPGGNFVSGYNSEDGVGPVERLRWPSGRSSDNDVR